MAQNHFIRGVVAAVLGMTLAGGASLGFADEVKIGCGGPTGVYTTVLCPALRDGLAKKGVNDVALENADGAGANAQAVLSGKLTAGLSQMDVLVSLIAQNPEYGKLIPMGQIVPEGLFLVVRAQKNGGKISSWSVLAKDGPGALPAKFKIGIVGSEKGGSYLTMKTIFAAIPALSQNVELVTIMDQTPEEAYNHLNSGRLHGVAFVMMPDAENSRIKAVADSGGNYQILSIDDPRIEAIQINDEPVYKLASVDLGGAGKVTTPITYATLLVNPAKTAPELRQALLAVATDPKLLPPTTVAGKAKNMFTGLWKSTGGKLFK